MHASPCRFEGFKAVPFAICKNLQAAILSAAILILVFHRKACSNVVIDEVVKDIFIVCC